MLGDVDSLPIFLKRSLLHLSISFLKGKSNQGGVDKVEKQISDD